MNTTKVKFCGIHANVYVKGVSELYGDKRANGIQIGLLEYISLKMNVSYLSELHYINSKRKMYEVISDIPESAYETREWKDAAEYLAGKSNSQNAMEAKEDLLSFYK